MPVLQALDLRKFASLLQRLVPEAGVLMDVAPIPKAFGYESYRLVCERAVLHLKFAYIPDASRRFARTAEAVHAARAHGVRVPAILYMGETGVWVGDVSDQVNFWPGRPFLLQEYLPGCDAEEAWPTMDQPARIAFLRELGYETARLHTIGAQCFNEAIVAVGHEANWQAHMAVRLRRLERDLMRSRALDLGLIRKARTRLQRLADGVAPSVRPALVHRDLSLRNTLIEGGRFAALLDFEHARFSDPVLEQVALYLSLFNREPGLLAPFLEGYRSVIPHPYPNERDRFELLMGMELLGRLAYAWRTGRHDKDLAARVAAWLDVGAI